MRVIAAMSGGVDSSVAAARMIDAGHEVVGVHLALARTASGEHEGAGSASSPRASRGCCTLEDARDARRAADVLGIPFYVWDLSERFRDEVIVDFVDEYRRGRTPNPCLRCNERIKFSAVLDRARAMDFDVVATGHYARIEQGTEGPELHRAVDPDKDQSYVLGVLTPEQLAHAAFPLGADTKAMVRREAAERGLAVAGKPDSHDICFIPDGDTASFVRRELGSSPGDIVDVTSGAALARHEGAHAFTIGQRRGLGLTVPADDGAPRYVVDVQVQTGTVLVGPAELLDIDVIEGVRPNWAGAPVGPDPVPVHAQVRAHGRAVPAVAQVRDGVVIVTLDEPVRGLAAGQAVVLYDGTRVVGSATVDRTRRLGAP